MILITTASGRRIDLEHPLASDIHVEDVAAGLGKCCRFAGQIPVFYSVAQHACLVASLVDPQYGFAALHHDDSEAYMGDLSRNLKHHPLLDGYRVLEARLSAVIEERFGILEGQSNPNGQVKLADNLACIFEHIRFRLGRQFSLLELKRQVDEGFVGAESFKPLAEMAGRLPYQFYPLNPIQAEGRYLGLHHAYEGADHVTG